MLCSGRTERLVRCHRSATLWKKESNLMFIGRCIIAIVDEWKTNLMSLAVLFHLCAQHVSDINISIFMSLRLCWWITTSVVLFSVRCVLELLVRADILMSETCWAHNKWHKIASVIKLVFHSPTIAMMHGPINIRLTNWRIHPATAPKCSLDFQLL